MWKQNLIQQDPAELDINMCHYLSRVVSLANESLTFPFIVGRWRGTLSEYALSDSLIQA